MKTLRVWWPRTPKPGNLGDVLTPPILERVGYRAQWSPLPVADVLALGSIARFAGRHHTVFGSGIISERDRLDPRARYLAVRGPLTRSRALERGADCPAVYGDPALLLAEFMTEPVHRVHDLGLVPHYVDRTLVAALHPNERRIDVLRADPLEVVREIRQCRSIVSSSLHGIIVAHAFGIPAAWLKWSNRLTGDDVKFRDYAMSVGITLEPHGDLGSAVAELTSPDAEALAGIRAGLIEAARGIA